jgi:CRISPR-associated protein Cas6
MRMYNPEWEAIKDFDHTARFKDVAFDLAGSEIPADHGHALFEELARHLPWLRDTPGVGVHPVHAGPSGRNDNLVINRRVKLVLRLPVDRLADARALVGTTINPGAGELKIGDLKERQLTPFAYLYSHFVSMDTADEAEFMQAVRDELDKMEIRCGLIPGKQRKMTTPSGDVWGYSLMLHDVDLRQSLLIQEVGIGLRRNQGCGIFIPHKSIKEVVIN